MLPAIHDLIDLALREDIGTGDITSETTIPDDVMAKGIILSKDEGIIVGLDVAGEVFHSIDAEVDFSKLVSDGDKITKGQELVVIEGKARSLLTAERIALNFLQRLSGVQPQHPAM